MEWEFGRNVEILNSKKMSKVIEVSFEGSVGEVVGSEGRGGYLKHEEFERGSAPAYRT
jgi:hypothetical protein